MKKFLQLWLIIGIVAGFSTIIFFILNYLNTEVLCDVDCSIRNRVAAALIFSALLAMFAGSLTYYFISEKYEKRIVKLHKDMTAFYRFLPPDQRTVLKTLLVARGEMLQSELVRKTGLSRVKISRLLKMLEQKQILSLKEEGMTNRVILAKDVRNLLL